MLIATCGLCSWGIAEVLRRHSVALGFTDAPNWRSSHTVETPRAGGLGFAIAAPVATLLAWRLTSTPVASAGPTLLCAALFVAMVGLIDDRWSVRASVRFALHALAAAVLIGAGGILHEVVLPDGAVLSLGPVAVPVTFLWLVGVTNIYNFMDGIDGLAASQAVVAAGAMGTIGACLGHHDLVIAMAAVAAGALGFLVLNRPPARVFMGDVGSTFLGFTFAGWAVVSATRSPQAIPTVAWLAVLSPFLFDASCTLLRRLWRRERIYQAHRTHFYQQLVQSGWTHRSTTGLYAGLAAAAALLTYFSVCRRVMPTALCAAAIALPLVIPLILRRVSKDRTRPLPGA